VEPIHPLWSHLYDSARTPYHWMVEQSEWATDIRFRSADFMSSWYPRWIQHGINALSCQDALRYLGKKVPDSGYGRCSDEAKIDVRTRVEGTRLKFWYGSNSLKRYDKEAPIAHALHLETTVNDPKAFQVFRTKEGEGSDAPKAWLQMRKGVADLDRRAEVSQAANHRFAESLASVAETTPLGKLLEPLCQPAQAKNGRRVRALHPSAGSDGALLRCLAQGDFLVNGFRNRDVRATLYRVTHDAKEQHQQAAAITRKLAMLLVSPRLDREAATRSPLSSQRCQQTRHHGAPGRLPSRRKPFGRSGIKSLHHTRNSMG